MINISNHVAEAIAKERLNPKQLRMLGEAVLLANEKLFPTGMYQIQFDNNRSVKVVGNGKPCQASLYIKRIDAQTVFTSRFGNPTSQLGLDKFIKDNS